MSNTLYLMLSRKIGSPELVSTMLDRALSDSNLIEVMEPQLICQNLVSLNLAGVDPSNTDFMTYARGLAHKPSLAKLSKEERAVLEQICLKSQKH